MTPRERLLRAYHLEETDRIPVTLSYIDPFAEPEVWPREGYIGIQRMARERSDILLPASPGGRGILFSSSDEVTTESTATEEDPYIHYTDTLVTPEGRLQRKSKLERGINTAWIYEGYIKSGEDVDKVLSVPYEPLEVDATPILEAVESLGDRGVVATGVGDPICNCADLYTLRDFALVASRKAGTMRRLLKFFSGRIEDFTRQLAEQCSEVLFRVVGPEYATPPILSPDLFEEYVVQFDRRLVRIIKDSGNIACIHCHGRIGTVIDGLGRIGPHVLEPVEPPPGGDIHLADIKDSIGDETCLMGHIQHNDLEFRPPEVIRNIVRSNMKTGGMGGGYIAFPTARPYASVSDRLLRNYAEVIATVHRYGNHVRR